MVLHGRLRYRAQPEPGRRPAVSAKPHRSLGLRELSYGGFGPRLLTGEVSWLKHMVCPSTTVKLRQNLKSLVAPRTACQACRKLATWNTRSPSKLVSPLESATRICLAGLNWFSKGAGNHGIFIRCAAGTPARYS